MSHTVFAGGWLETLQELTKSDTETLSEQMSLGQWCHGPIRLAQCKVARNLQFVKMFFFSICGAQ